VGDESKSRMREICTSGSVRGVAASLYGKIVWHSWYRKARATENTNVT